MNALLDRLYRQYDRAMTRGDKAAATLLRIRILALLRQEQAR